MFHYIHTGLYQINEFPPPPELAALVSRLMLDWWVRERCGVHHQGQPIRRQGISETKPGDELTYFPDSEKQSQLVLVKACSAKVLVLFSCFNIINKAEYRNIL